MSLPGLKNVDWEWQLIPRKSTVLLPRRQANGSWISNSIPRSFYTYLEIHKFLSFILYTEQGIWNQETEISVLDLWASAPQLFIYPIWLQCCLEAWVTSRINVRGWAEGGIVVTIIIFQFLPLMLWLWCIALLGKTWRVNTSLATRKNLARVAVSLYSIFVRLRNRPLLLPLVMQFLGNIA